ncbi:efflux RND transporter periplasmic adaptor subunit [Burkholderia sp. BCCIQ04A]|uniref:Efflux RND transporter periplasmic adaptor subunit n=1 Tax=Burkholderia anthinoferrum TaxID=3090833 RepID=A0ABU5WLX0_9BURK|nr:MULTISPECIES: efflux RND transporter periplasmic adaptor subunit [Burkholderia]MEB2507735.1 efflux RND transporter periplasmic adaptor subunit [Burkholderia anthinoferrum]MEB2532527.1 efflux RND transporter periplasmic adaptor subunit [Burkholderia anthinoferrum]MEB2565642.1 efflux RND transporter periplasmic adaptor subunit [Burkholderia anthinoferrum]MEB2579985.1 efflux RND transporter periplasmic adaptor subunit [Burkholderia anthinoferrum]KVH03932.1 hemolysin secretion protein D [Burkho
MTQKTHRRRRIVLATLAVVAIAAGVTLKACAPDKHPQYLSAPVTRGNLENAVLATGALQAFRQVDVGAQVSGQLKTLKVKLGDKVTKGQWLAEIDPVISENALRQARASEESLRAQQQSTAAQLTQAELAFRRQQAMLPDDATSRESFEAARATLDVQRATLASLAAQIRSARIQIETAQANLGYTRIVAPIDGEVVAIVTQEGQTVIAQQQAPVILKLANLDTMTVKAQVSEADVIRVSAGQTAYFTILGEPDKRHYGKLRAIEPAPQNYAEAQSALGGGGSGGSTKPNSAVFYNALFDVPNPGHRLRIAMTAQVNIVLGNARNALSIPAAALGDKRKDGTYAVRVLRADGGTDTRHVRIGINNNVRVEVLAGLKDGERVVIGEASPDERAPLADAV